MQVNFQDGDGHLKGKQCRKESGEQAQHQRDAPEELHQRYNDSRQHGYGEAKVLHHAAHLVESGAELLTAVHDEYDTHHDPQNRHSPRRMRYRSISCHFLHLIQQRSSLTPIACRGSKRNFAMTVMDIG